MPSPPRSDGLSRPAKGPANAVILNPHYKPWLPKYLRISGWISLILSLNLGGLLIYLHWAKQIEENWKYRSFWLFWLHAIGIIAGAIVIPLVLLGVIPSDHMSITFLGIQVHNPPLYLFLGSLVISTVLVSVPLFGINYPSRSDR